METKNNFNVASTLAQYTDNTFWFIFIISAICLVGITVFMLYCCVRYSRKNNPRATQIHGSLLLETMWTVIPTILVLIMFWMSWEGYKFSREVPEGAYEIKVTASQWAWKFEYPKKDGKGPLKYVSKSRPALEGTEKAFEVLKEPKSDKVFKKWINSMVVPINTPIKLNLYSKDVIHSFSAPAFRVKNDCMPKPDWQKPNYLWFQATELGLYDVNCTEFCGVEHSQMNTYIKVVTQKEFDLWLDDMTAYSQRVEESMPGFVLYRDNCASCHMNEDGGPKGQGPSFKGILTRKRDVITDKGVTKAGQVADLEYITEAIRDPKATTVVGYPVGLMPGLFAGFTDEQIKQIYEYLETIK